LRRYIKVGTGGAGDMVMAPDACAMQLMPYPISGRVNSKVTKGPLARATVLLYSRAGAITRPLLCSI
jgi:hypothetical protein